MKKLVFVSISFSIGLSLTAAVVNLGSASYTDAFPGKDSAGRNGYIETPPMVSGVAAGRPVPTNDWWSNELVSNHGQSMFNYPLGIRTQDDGLGIVNNMHNQAIMQGDGPLVVGLKGLNCAKSTVSDHSDWTVTFNWDNKMEAIVAQASPFVYFTKSDAADVTIRTSGSISTVNGNILLVTGSYNQTDYAVYAPSGSSWTISGNTATSSLSGKNYFSAVMLPVGRDAIAIAKDWEKYAFVFPKDTRADFTYNQQNGEVVTVYKVMTDVKEGQNNTFLMGLLPHHWANAVGLTGFEASSYQTIRGELKLIGANEFKTSLKFHGVLPTLPAVTDNSKGFSQTELDRLCEAVINNDGFQDWTDSYNDGQLLNRLIQVARIAKEAGNVNLFNRAFSKVKERVERWFTYKQGDVAFLFYYHSPWTTLLGYPAGHSQDTNINDHHFHWGYLIHAAAFIEQYQPGWKNQWGDMVNLLVRDAASDNRNDSMFPYLRNFSPYAGHSWANGTANLGVGNDQESTSESMQFACSLIHWGELSGNIAIRDLGIYLYVTEASAIEEYWFDVYKRNLAPDFKSYIATRVFTNGYDDQNFWGAGIEGSYGIHVYPVHAGSFYLVHNSGFAKGFWDAMTRETGILSNEVQPNLWYDAWARFYSMVNPQKALEFYNGCTQFDNKFGDSKAHTYHWIHALALYGKPDQTVTASSPFACVFDNNGARTYVVQNYGSTEQMITFSDGYIMNVPANTLYAETDGEPLPGVDPEDPDPDTPDPDDPNPDNPVTGDRIDFAAENASQGSLAGNGYFIFAWDGENLKVYVHFDGDYSGFVGPWLWNYTDGFVETEMKSEGDGLYSLTLTGYRSGQKVRVASKVAYTGGMGVTPIIEYTIPDTVSGITVVTNSNDPEIEYYNLQGIRIKRPVSGVYLKRNGNKVIKIIVR